jgi:CubicO group peptidase (beta-lactamase class C family)
VSQYQPFNAEEALPARDLTAVDYVLQQSVAQGAVSAAVAAVGKRDSHVVVGAHGVTCLPAYRLAQSEPDDYADDYVVQADTRFDVASLTKVVSTLSSLTRLEQAGWLSFDDSIRRFFASAGWFHTPSLGDATIADLLSHQSGLPAWRALFAVTNQRDTAFANVLQSALETPGQLVYSDLGMILAGAIIEVVTGMRQDAFAGQLFTELGMENTEYLPLMNSPQARANIAATEYCGWRRQLLWGDVHDENAWTLGGVAGHAGLFSTAADLAVYARAWLNLDERLGRPDLLKTCTQTVIEQDGKRQSYGWHLKHHGDNYVFAGEAASETGYGHTGFTGTSMWLEPEQDWFAVLLTNRIHPSRFASIQPPVSKDISHVRTQFHLEAAKALQGSA